MDIGNYASFQVTCFRLASSKLERKLAKHWGVSGVLFLSIRTGVWVSSPGRLFVVDVFGYFRYECGEMGPGSNLYWLLKHEGT